MRTNKAGNHKKATLKRPSKRKQDNSISPKEEVSKMPMINQITLLNMSEIKEHADELIESHRNHTFLTEKVFRDINEKMEKPKHQGQ